VRPLLPPGTRPQWLGKRVDLYRATMAFEQYAPRIKAPILWLSSTNDFHGQMDDMYRTGDLVPHGNVRYSVAPHLNHRFTPPFAIARPMWIDQHLKGGREIPKTPRVVLELDRPDGVPRLVVIPDREHKPAFVEVYYSVDYDPRSRFWRATSVAGGVGTFEAKLPIASIDRPLFAHANVHYALDEPETLYRGETTDSFAISSKMVTATPGQLADAEVKTTAEPSRVIDDFRQGWRNWYSLSANNAHHWQHWTRRITDPLYRGPDGSKLRIVVHAEQDNTLVVALHENTWRHYRGPKRTYVAEVPIKGGTVDAITLAPSDFREVKYDVPLESWAELDEIGLMARFESRTQKRKGIYGAAWHGAPPTFRSLVWIEGKE